MIPDLPHKDIERIDEAFAGIFGGPIPVFIPALTMPDRRVIKQVGDLERTGRAHLGPWQTRVST